MASSAGAGGSLPPNFFLTPQQQSLLYAALNSNKQVPASTSDNGGALPPSAFRSPPLQSLDNNLLQDGQFTDGYDYDTYNDSSFDFSFTGDEQAKMMGDVPVSARSDSTEGEVNEKRSLPEDEDDEDSPENDPKRRESGEKVPKKPGRKPLTSEPSSKRKAQNRAAQRAFRERKEKHLKDLETKVEELEKASEATNHENSKLRAQVDRMTSELKQYKQRLTVMNSSTKPAPREGNKAGNTAVDTLSDVNFQFEFPRFGMLPGPPVQQERSPSQPISPQQSGGVVSPPKKTQSYDSRSAQLARDRQFKEDLAKFSNIYTPSMSSSSAPNGSRASLDSGHYSTGAATSSPSASSHSNLGPSSSCGTSPEPLNQSPMGFKPVDTMTTIGEEQPGMSAGGQQFAQFANVDINSPNFDLLANQNGGQFDPQLFGDYREPQDNILANPNFDDFFNEALEPDFFMPYNAAPVTNWPKKTNICDEIDAKKESQEIETPKKDGNMNCTEFWEKLHSCPKAQNGDFDLDGLCSELTKKAKCSGTGPVVAENDFDTILQKYMGKDVSAACFASKMGIEVDRTGGQSGSNLP